VAEGGVAEVAAASGGGIGELDAGVEEAGAEVEEAAEGETIAVMPGAYFFAFSKKLHNMERGQPLEELTFSQLASSPCA
jgi:hypothetical protein